MDAKIVFYNQSGLDQNSKFKLRKELLGLKQKSNFSRYSYKVNGILDEIPHYKPIDSAIIIEKESLKRIKAVLGKHKVKCEVFNIEVPRSKLSIK